jgi:hypothetical protein
MKMQFLLVSVIGAGLFVLVPGGLAGGGAGHGGGSSAGHGGGASVGHRGGSWAGHGGNSWGSRGHGGWANHGGGPPGGFHGGSWSRHGRVAWGRHGHGFRHGGRSFGPGFGFYGFGYPWWWDWPYPGYAYYPNPDSYYGDPYDGSIYYGNTDDQPRGNGDARWSSAKALQAELARRGYYHGSIDGMLGPETRNAIRSFQAHQGLPVTGQVDGQLINALQS